MSLLWAAGAYEGDYIHDFMERELAALGIRTFADLRRTDDEAAGNLTPYQRYKLVVTATDLSPGRLLRLPWDYPSLDLDPDAQRAAAKAHASISIPVYSEPV